MVWYYSFYIRLATQIDMEAANKLLMEPYICIKGYMLL